MKKYLSAILALSLCLGLAVTAAAAPAATVQILTEAVYDDVGQFSDGLIGARTVLERYEEGHVKTSEVAYLDDNGKIAFTLHAGWGDEDSYDIPIYPNNFHEGYMTDYVDWLVSIVVDKTGKPPAWMDGSIFTKEGEDLGRYGFREGYAVGFTSIRKADGTITYEFLTIGDTNGKPRPFTFVSEGLIPASKGDETSSSDADGYHETRASGYGYCDVNGNWVIAPTFEDTQPFDDGRAFAKSGGKWGVIDKTGTFVIPPQFENFYVSDAYEWQMFCDGLALVQKDGKWGYINAQGDTVIPFIYDEIPIAFLNGYAVFKQDGKSGYIDKTGNVAIPAQYDDANWFNADGIALVGKNGVYSLIDTSGKSVSGETWEFDSTLMHAFAVSHGVFAYQKGDKYGIAKINTPTAGNPTPPTTAKPTSSHVLVNGTQTSFDAYNIADNNYFKLRDLAYVLSGTPKQFEVGYDGATKAITLTSGQSYTAVGGEMESSGAGNMAAIPTRSKIYFDGAEISLTAYNIDGYNYFKLRDIGQAFDFGVDWDGARNTIVIDTGKGYTPD
jgi:hypothetical protein